MQYIKLLSFVFGTFPFLSKGQDFVLQEKQLLAIYQEARACYSECRVNKMDSFERLLLAFLKNPESWSCSFAGLTDVKATNGLSGYFKVVYSPDSNFRLFSYEHHTGWNGPANYHEYHTLYQIRQSGFCGILDATVSVDAFFWGNDQAYQIIRMATDAPLYLLVSNGANGYKEHLGEGAYSTTWQMSIKCLKLDGNSFETYKKAFPASECPEVKTFDFMLSVIRKQHYSIYPQVMDDGLLITVYNNGLATASMKHPRIKYKWIWKNDHFEQQEP